MKKIGFVLVASLFLVACHKLVGGGWFYGLDGERVTFGFQARCVEDVDSAGRIYDTGWHEGQFQYNDRANRIRFHGDIQIRLYSGQSGRSCGDGPGISGPWNEAEISGICRSQPGNYEGVFTAYVEDHGVPGPSVGDYIEVDANCTVDGQTYHNEGVLGGGNISSLDHKDEA